MSRAIVSPEAVQDIEEITEYIEADSSTAADRLLSEIDAAFSLIAGMPGLGHTRRDLTSRDLLFWPIRQRYLVIYRQGTTGVEIIRMLDGRRDVASLLA